ncbi:MAG: LacI family DNA-binding transcriptional regulator [Acholeplasmatales bacterium]|nr:LacI family DNA-binding transcriptional regulator [Acholeplasmatales bacterium]
MANTTIYDVAGAAKVSLATVSRVMNNPEKVNPETRARVLKVIKELGYRPNAIARGLASRKTTTVGIVMADVSRASTAQLLGGIIDIAKKYDYAMKIFSMAENEDIKEVMRSVVAEQVDGILFLNDELEIEQMNSVINQIQEAGIPVVLCNVSYDDIDVPSVSIDYEKATYEITKELLNAGKKDVYLASTVRKYTVNFHKVKGYTKAMEEAGLEPLIIRTSGDVSINTLHFQEFIKNKKFDALISVRDSIAISFMNCAIKAGYRVPEDVSVVGLQNTKYAILSRPNLTCVDTPVYDIGAVSMRLLTKYMQHEEVNETKILLPYRVVERESN